MEEGTVPRKMLPDDPETNDTSSSGVGTGTDNIVEGDGEINLAAVVAGAFPVMTMSPPMTYGPMMRRPSPH